MNPAAAFFVEEPSAHLVCIVSSRASGRMTARAMSRCNSWSSAGVWRSCGDGFIFKSVEELARLEGFVVDLVKGGNPGVPFQKRGRPAGQPNGVLVKFPHRINHRMIVRVQNELLIAGV